jgi:hypothetical protein
MTTAETITRNARPATDITAASVAWCVICDGNSGDPVCSPDGLIQILTMAPAGEGRARQERYDEHDHRHDFDPVDCPPQRITVRPSRRQRPRPPPSFTTARSLPADTGRNERGADRWR